MNIILLFQRRMLGQQWIYFLLSIILWLGILDGIKSFSTRSSKTIHQVPAFIPRTQQQKQHHHRLYMIYAPPGSGYARPEDETSELPDSYEPMMEYPGTMRPGRTPENSPFHDLPIGDDDPDPVPWPHFQQIQWHHRWEPAHPHPVPMDLFIEQQGRWATPEQEAAMRAGTRKASRMRRELEEEKKRETLIMDDEEDDDSDLPQDLGEGVFGALGSTADAKITAEATSPEIAERAGETEEDEDEFEDDMGLDDFLLDLGLDSMDDDEEGEEEDFFDDDDDDDDDVKPAMKRKQPTVITTTASSSTTTTTSIIYQTSLRRCDDY